jgi:hypothetical protein
MVAANQQHHSVRVRRVAEIAVRDPCLCVWKRLGVVDEDAADQRSERAGEIGGVHLWTVRI